MIYTYNIKIVMYIKWTDSELDFIKEKYESGLNKDKVFELYCIEFGNNRTLDSIWLVIKRKKYKHTKQQTTEIKREISSGKKNGMHGKKSWMNGLNKKTSQKILNYSEKLSSTRKKMFKDGLLNVSGTNNGMYGRDSWCKGLSKENSESLRIIGEKNSVIKKERWKGYTQDERDSIIGKMTLAANKKKKNTYIEEKVEILLKEIGVFFIKQFKNTKYVFDFFIPEFNLVIECQGDYWHANPYKYNESNINEIQRKNICRDFNKKEFLTNNSINSLFIWERDINKNISIVKSNILLKLKN